VFARRVVIGGALCALILFAASGPEARDVPLEGWFDLALPGGEPALRVLGFTPDERAFVLPMMARALFDRDLRSSAIDARLSRMLAEIDAHASESVDLLTIPAPLDAAVWRDILPAVKPPASTDLFTRIITDRSALLTAYGLVATTDGIRAFLSRDRDTLRFIYQQAPGAFAVVSRTLALDGGHIVVPGGSAADAAWQQLVGVAPSRPGPFLRALLSKDQGRLAWYYDTIGTLDADRLQAVWPNGGSLAQPATALYPAFREPDPQWRLAEQPFRRGPTDAWTVLTLNPVINGGVPSPLPQATWALLFSNGRPGHNQVVRTLEDGAPTVSLPWLARETLTPIVRERRNRHEMFRLAQRVFADAAPGTRADVAMGVAGFRHYRALGFTLERMQIREPAVWVAAMQAARHVSDASDHRRDSLAIFQSLLAIVERMRHVRTIDPATTTQLIRSLSKAVQVDKDVPRSAAMWIIDGLMPAIPALIRPDAFTVQTAYESTILQSLAGAAERNVPTLEWEGLTYTSDPVAAEHERLQHMRTLLPSPGLDAALASRRPRELADALMVLVYATALGDPTGPASLSPDVVARHQFGLEATALLREELPWSPPEERQGSGPWHVQGSLLGLDLAMSRLFLRRVADQQMPLAPTLTLNDVATLTRTGAGMVASELEDGHRDELAAALARGRARVTQARNLGEFLALARECRMSASTQQLLTWVLSRQRDTAPTLFALRDLMWLGKPNLSSEVLDRWGVSAEGLDGRRVPAMPGPNPWEDYAGRSEVGQVTTQVPDLTLRLVEETARLQLPASLVPSLLAFALEDYWHDVRARFSDDWPRLTQQAAALSSLRIHDYVAALAGGGPLRAP
jgi:hypothetical protein